MQHPHTQFPGIIAAMRLAVLMIAAVVGAAWSARSAEAEPRTLSPAINAVANLDAISVYATYVGDDNNDNSVRLEYKDVGSSTWLPGMAMHSIREEKRAAGFIFAKPGVTYSVRAVFTDPDGLSTTTPPSMTVSARTDVVPAGSGNNYYVSPQGSDANPGSAGSPFRTIAKAVSLVKAGDTVLVTAGTYREYVKLGQRSGTASNWITIQATGDGPAILDGADKSLIGVGRNRWALFGGSIYRVPLSYAPQSYLAIDEVRLYHYPSLAELQAGISGIVGGWAYESGFLYVRTPDGSTPDQHAVAVAKLSYGLELSGTSYVEVKGLTLKHYGGAAIRLTGKDSYIQIEQNTFQNNCFGIRKSDQGGGFYTVQDNTFTETGVFAWPWGSVKHTEHEAAGVALFAVDQGTVIRRNTITGYFDAIDVNYWPPALGYVKDVDITNNTLADCLDDGAELEGSNHTNVRFWNNAVRRCKSGVSLDPVLRGPIYVFRNTMFQIADEGFKVGTAKLSKEGLASVGAAYAYHNTVHAVGRGTNGDGVACTDAPSYASQTYRNNIWYVGRYVIDHANCTSNGVTFDYDLMGTTDGTRFVQWDKQTRYATLSDFQKIGQAKSARQGIAIFVDDSAGDLHLVPASPGIDSGVALPGFNDANSPWPAVGTGPDVGAFELIP